MDLFARRLNAKASKYVSWKRDPYVYATDAFSLHWASFLNYAFPPFSLNRTTIEKFVEDRERGILIVPCWPMQTWWGRIVSLILCSLRFREKKDNLRYPGAPQGRDFVNKSPLVAFLFWPDH